MPTTAEKIAAIKENGYDLDFSRVFENAFENYKKIALISGIAILLFSILIFGIIIGVAGIFWGFSSITENFSHLDPKSLSGVTILFYILGIGVFSGLVSPFTAGVFKIAHYADTAKDFSFGTLFEYYSSSHFKQLFIATTIIAIVSAGINTLLESNGIRFAGAFFSYCISFFTFLVVPLIIFGNLKALDAIKGSSLLVAKQFFVNLGLVIVAVILACLGLIGFCIGIFFTIPFIYSTYYSIYKDTIGFED